MTSPIRPMRFRPPIAGGAAKTGWEALEKWVGSGDAAPASDAAASSAPSGKTGWEALDKWVGGSGEKIGDAVERAVDTVQERAAELKEDLKEIREKLPMDEIESAGKGFFAALKKMFSGK